MNESIKISVVMPVFNEESYLSESLDSFFSQSIADQCEIICVDDGSTDDSPQILARYKSAHPENMAVEHQENSGSGGARNRAIEVAKGTFVAFLDADDLYPSATTLEDLYKAAEEHRVDIAGGSLVIFSPEAESTDFAGIPGFTGHQFLESGVAAYRDYQFDYGYQRFIYRKTLLDEHHIRFKDYLRYQDPPFFVEAMIAARTFYAIAIPTYRYRTAQKNIVWTTRKAVDMIHAMTDVGCLAAANNLLGLFKLNLLRLNGDWGPTFKQLVIDEGDLTVLHELYAARLKMLSQQTDLPVSELLADTPSIDGALSDSFKELSALRRRTENLEQDLQHVHSELDAARAELDLARNELNRTLSSTAWKTGRAITFLPRHIKKALSN